MAIDDWSDNKFGNLLITIFIMGMGFFIITSIMLANYLEENKIKYFIDNGYQECLVFNPNIGEQQKVWQKKCQKIDTYYKIAIKKIDKEKNK